MAALAVAVRGANRETIYSITVPDEPLELIEMQPHPVVAARYLARIRPSLDDRADDHGVCQRTRRYTTSRAVCFSCRLRTPTNHHRIPHPYPRVRSQIRPDCNRPRLRLKREDEGKHGE